MGKPGRRASLEKLEEKRAALDAEIRAVKREERKREIEAEKQRFSILGRALAKELSENHELAAKLEPLIDARVTSARDRKVLGLPPLAKKSPAATGQ